MVATTFVSPACRPAAICSNCFTSCRRQAPTSRHAIPTLLGGSDDASADTGRCSARAPRVRELKLGVSMAGILWNLSGTDKQCDSFAPGHLVHWGFHKLSVRDPGPEIPVTATGGDDGIVFLEGDDLV